MPFFQSSHGSLYYETHGHGPSIALLHGMWSNLGTWKKMVPELCREHRVVLLDNMGHGRSDRLRVPYCLMSFASDLDRVLNSLNTDRVALVGFSMGALIAQEYYFLNPARVSSLVLIATPPPCKISWRIGMSAVSLLEKLRITSLKKEAIKAFSRRANRGSDEKFIDKNLREISSYGDREFALILQSVWKTQYSGREREIRVPTLIIVGEKDGIRPHSVHLQRAIPRSRLLIIPGCDHAGFFARSDSLTPEILGFLTEAHQGSLGR